MSVFTLDQVTKEYGTGNARVVALDAISLALTQHYPILSVYREKG